MKATDGLRFTPEDTLRVQSMLEAFQADDLDRILEIVGLYVGPEKTAPPLQLISALVMYIDTLADVMEIISAKTYAEIIATAQHELASRAWEGK